MTKDTGPMGQPFRNFADRLFGSSAVPTLLKAVLLAASLLKAHQAASEELLDQSLATSQWFILITALFEMVLGIWLLSGAVEVIARWVALFAFFLFFEAALHQELLAAPTCGCFGRLRVLPWQAMLIDMAAMLLLFLWRPLRHQQTAIHRHWIIFCAVAYLICASVVTVSVLDYVPTRAMKRLRHDPRLCKKVYLHLKNATAAEVVDQVHEATRLNFDVAGREVHTGDVNTTRAPAWAALEWVAQKQPEPCRWVETADGYRLVRGAPLGLTFPWILTALILATVVIGSPMISALWSHPEAKMETSSCMLA